MGFDWMAFATSFLEEEAKDIRENKAEAKEYFEEQKDLARDNMLTLSKRNAVVSQAKGLSKMLSDAGASKDQIQAAIASGPDGLTRFANSVVKAKEVYGDTLSAADFDTIIALPENFQALDMPIDKYIESTFGTYSPTIGPSEDETKYNWWETALGSNAMDRSRAKLDRDVIYEGMTAADINELARQADYKTLIPSTFAAITDIRRFGAAESLGIRSTIEDAINTLNTPGSRYNSSIAIIEKFSGRSSGVLQPEEEESLLAAQTYVKDQNERALRPLFDETLALYGTQAYTGLKDLMQMHMGTEYLDSLKSVYGPAVSEITGGGNNTPKAGDNEGKVEALSDNEVKLSHPNFMKDDKGDAIAFTFQMDVDGLPVSATASTGEEVASNDVMELYSDMTSFVAPGVIKRPEDLEVTAQEKNLDFDPLSITREQFEELSRQERKNLGLPERNFGGGFMKFGTEEGMNMVDLKRNADPDAFYKINIAPLGNFKIKGENLKYVPDQNLSAEQGGVEVYEFDVDEKIPRRTMSASRLKKLYGKEPKEAVTVETGGKPEGLMSSPRPKPRPEVDGQDMATDIYNELVDEFPEMELLKGEDGKEIIRDWFMQNDVPINEQLITKIQSKISS